MQDGTDFYHTVIVSVNKGKKKCNLDGTLIKGEKEVYVGGNVIEGEM